VKSSMSYKCRPIVSLTDEQKKQVEQWRGLAYKLARSFYFSNLSCLSYGTMDDYVQEAMVTLCRCSQIYDPKKGVKFETYVWNSIQNNLKCRAAYRTLIRTPPYRNDKQKYSNHVKDARKVSSISVVRRSACRKYRVEEDSVLDDTFWKESDYDRRMDVAKIIKDNLTPKQIRVLRWRYWEDMKCDEISQIEGNSRQAVSRMLIRIQKKLRLLLGDYNYG